MSEGNFPTFDAEVVRLKTSSAITAVEILAIGWIGGVIAHLMVSEVGGWLAWVAVAAILCVSAVWGELRSRSHTLYAASIGAAIAANDIEWRKHG